MVVSSSLAVRWFLAPHLRLLSELGEVTLFVRLDRADELDDLQLPVKIVGIPIQRKIALLSDCLVLFLLVTAFLRHRFDMVHTVTPKAGLLGIAAAKFAGIRVRVHTFQGELWVNRRGFMRQLLRFTDVITARAATHVTVVSRSERDFLEKNGVLAQRGAVVLGAGTIGGIDLERFQPNDEHRRARRAELGIGTEEVAFIFVGRLCTDKGVPILVSAMREVATSRPDCHLLVVGPDEERMVDRIENDLRPLLRDRLKVVPFTKVPEEFIAAADVLVLPSSREGFGMVVLEAAAMGVPAIGSDIYGLTDAIDPQTGLLVPVGDVAALHQAMATLMENRPLREALGRAALARVRAKFSSTDIMREYNRYYCELLSICAER